MDAIVVFAWFLRNLVWLADFAGYELDEATKEHMQQRAEMLWRDMTRLWNEIALNEREMELKEREQEQSSFAWRVPLLAALQQWQFWALAGVLLLLFGLCWWLRKWSHRPASSSKGDSSRRNEDEEKRRENPSSALDSGRLSANHLLDTSKSLLMTAELPNELLQTSQKPSRDAYMLRPRPVRGLGNTLASPSPHEDGAVSRWRVPQNRTCWLCDSSTAPKRTRGKNRVPAS